MKIAVLTSDNYLPALRPFAHLFNKYWADDQLVDVVGFAPPQFHLPANFNFISLGSQSNYPISKWSNALIDYLERYVRPNNPHCILMLEDYWLTRPVNVDAVRKLDAYANQFRDVLKIDLTADRLYAAGMADYDNCSYLDLVSSDPASQYQMSLMTGIWNVELMLDVLRPNETPWQVELEGTPRVRAKANRMRVIGTRQWPVRHTLAHRRGDPSHLLLDELKPVDIDQLRYLDLLPERK